MIYYRFIPIWKDNTRPQELDGWTGGVAFIGDNRICYTKFSTLEDGIEAARLDGTCLREQNWEIFRCSWFHKTRIMLKSLWKSGLLAPEINHDNISEYYSFITNSKTPSVTSVR